MDPRIHTEMSWIRNTGKKFDTQQIAGRRNTFHIYTLGAIPIFGSLPYLIGECVRNPTGPGLVIKNPPKKTHPKNT
jgi:hypothetical protein